MAQSILFQSIKNEIKETLSISIPLISSQIIYACSGFIGTALVAQLGEDALAASVLVSMLWMSLSVLFFGILNSISVLVAHNYGAKNYRAISDVMGQSFVLGTVLTIIIFSILCCLPFFMRYTAQPPIVVKLAIEYMHALLWTIPGLVTLIVCEQFLAGINHAKLVLRISLFVVPVEIPLIYILIFGKLGLPACGVAGIGYGFAITYSIVAVGLVIYLYRSRKYQHFPIFDSIFKFDWRWLKELIRIGLPIGCMHAIEVSTFAIATFWIAKFGTTMLAAHQIVMQYLSFAITIVFAMSQAVTIRVGHAVGRKEIKSIRKSIYVGMLLNFICIGVIACTFCLIPSVFLRLDIDIHSAANQLLVRDTTALLSICSVLLIFDNFRIIGFGALRGLKDTKFPMYASFFSFWIVGLSLAFSFAFYMHLSGEGIWWGLTLGIVTGACIVFARIQYLLKHLDIDKLMQIH